MSVKKLSQMNQEFKAKFAKVDSDAMLVASKKEAVLKSLEKGKASIDSDISKALTGEKQTFIGDGFEKTGKTGDEPKNKAFKYMEP